MGTLTVNEAVPESASGSPAEGTVGGRYQLQQVIGRGGMAMVYRALDTVTGDFVALKQLRPRDQDDSQQRSRELFEREFHALTELTHPRIVGVRDYGFDAELPYYTMELLDGGDLLERAPLAWRDACAVARDICSALSLVHSRRMVYRDLSPRNVRCTDDGKAKLIDFGAMAPMGSAQLAVCTPAVASPEVVYRQELDGRSDLYALGATLYFTLAGRGAYPARTFQQLIELWQRPLVPPSEWVSDIPPALDALVMELLQLDPALRPVSAAEVSQRLCAVAGLENDEHLLVSQAYLSTPTLVGRERELDRVASMVQRTVRNARGSSMLVRGAAGMGRSRFLDACALSAKLAGMTVLRTSPATAPHGPFAAAQALASQLLELLPDETIAAAAPQGQVLCQLLPALRSKLGRTSEPASLDLQAQGQAALRGFLLEIASTRPLLIAIDDVERFDPDSRALVALLAHKASSNALLLVVASDKDAPDDGDDARMLTQASTLLKLEPLTVNETQALLASMFGDVPNLSILVRRIHALAAGSPQNAMRLAQHLLDRGVVRYSAGAWILADRIDDGDLPETMAQTFTAKVAALDADARELAQVFAHYADQRFSFDDCSALHAQHDRARVFRSIDQLLAVGVLTASVDDYALSSPAWIAPLSSTLEPELALRLSRVFLARDEGLRAVRCLFLSGRESDGLDALVEYARQSHQQTSADTASYVKLLSTLPHDWPELFEHGLALTKQLGRPAREEYLIRMRLSGIVSQNDVCSHGQQAAFAQRLAQDIGLDLHAGLDPALPPATRLQQALAGAAARYASTPEHDRMLDPKSAIGMLARTTIAAIGGFARSLDAAEWRQMPSLAPIAALSPSVAVVERLARGFEARLSGRFEDACVIYRETLAMLEAGDAGLDATFADSMRAALPGIIGFIEAVLGLPSSERCADEVAKFPLYQGSALAIRLLDRLWQGDVVGADRIARERELWRLEQPRQQTSDVLTVLWTLQGHAASDDLTHARNDLQAIERTAAKVRTWLPVAAWARGEYERIRGDHASALIALESALSRIDAGRHQVWPLAAGARLRVLCELGRVEEARDDGERYLATALEHGLGYVSAYLRMPLALAHAKLGDADAAWAHAQAAIEIFEGVGARGLHPGLAFETAARVAIALGDGASYERYAASCKQCYLAHPNPALAAKYQRLVRLSQRNAQANLDPSAAQPPGDSVLSRSQIESVLQGCSTRSERLQRVLQLLVMKAGAERGFLYGLNEGVPSLHARSDFVDPPPEIEQIALRYLESEITRDAETATADAGESGFSTHWTSGMRQCYVPVLLNHTGPQGFVISGLAVLMMDGSGPPRPVAETASQLSRFAVDCGDLPAFVVG